MGYEFNENVLIKAKGLLQGLTCEGKAHHKALNNTAGGKAHLKVYTKSPLGFMQKNVLHARNTFLASWC